MNKVYKITAVIFLLFNIIGAFYGGINLILYPDGSSIQLSLDLLEHAPFSNFLIPGIILLSANGLFGTFVLLKILKNGRDSGRLLIAQGVILTGWILIQIALIRTIFILHFILGGVGLILILLGWILNRVQKNNSRRTEYN
jgi:hypothetical protein